MLLILPIGSIEASDLNKSIAHEIVTEGAIRGLRLDANPTCRESLTLSILVSDISLSGYDFLFFRKPTASVSFSAKLIRSDQTVARATQVESSSSEIERFAFSKELSKVFEETLKIASRKAFDELGIL